MGNGGAAASQWRLMGSAASQRPMAVRPSGACGCGAWHRPGPKGTTHRRPLGTADRPGVGGLPRRACTVAGRSAVHDVARAGCRRVPVLNISA
jgi:hypothetical protein